MLQLGNLIRRPAGLATICLAAILGVNPTPALAGNKACNGVQVEVTKARKQEYAPLVAAAMENKVRPAQVEFDAMMESGDWAAVYISTPIADDGIMFFQIVNGRKQFRDVWGGYADPSEEPELVSWAKKLGAPQALAECFARTVTK